MENRRRTGRHDDKLHKETHMYGKVERKLQKQDLLAQTWKIPNGPGPTVNTGRHSTWAGPLNILNIGNDIGQHFMHEPTHYKSTVTSVVYKVSDGYSMEEEIRGLVTGTTVRYFFGNLNKANENQTLTVHLLVAFSTGQ
jgi:hypothetical protein